MKRRGLLSMVCLLALACSSNKPSSDTPPDSTSRGPVVEDPGVEPSPGVEIELSHFETTLTVEVGTQLRYSFVSHASVGLGGSFEIGDPAVLRHLRTDTNYEQSEQEREGKTGADKATGVFVFEASAPGSSSLRVTEVFRGETEREIDYTITVTP